MTNPNIELGFPSLAEYYMMLAHVVKSRANCLNRAVGAVLVTPDNNSVLATGYNGSPKGQSHCITCRRREEGYGPGEGLHRSRAAHAEENVLIQSARYGRPTDNAILYVTALPCEECSKLIINAGVKQVYYDQSYPNSEAATMLTQAGVIVNQTDHVSISARLKLFVEKSL